MLGFEYTVHLQQLWYLIFYFNGNTNVISFPYIFTGNMMRYLKSILPQRQEEQNWAPDSLLRLPLLKVTHPVEWSDLSIKV